MGEQSLQRPVMATVPPPNGNFAPARTPDREHTPRSNRMSPPATRVHDAAGS